ncbi:MAG: hypothetical protein KAQ92_09030, partial [Candidatus Aenigmarchaeota archaeon]|nr:hypothetical protein [Candidatus Aenigmarchaeota archaeon]
MESEMATKQIMDELKAIKIELSDIKRNMPDKEFFLDTEEKKLLEESWQNEKEEKLISSTEI